VAHIFERHTKIAENFWITYITCGKSECTSTIFLIIPVMLVPMAAAWLTCPLGWHCSQDQSPYLNLTGIILSEQDFRVLYF
jgi:hypothetical protein